MDRLSSPELHVGEDEAAPGATFGDIYPRYDYARLVCLALGLGRWLVDMRRRVEGGQLDMPGGPLPGGMKPVE